MSTTPRPAAADTNALGVGGVHRTGAVRCPGTPARAPHRLLAHRCDRVGSLASGASLFDGVVPPVVPGAAGGGGGRPGCGDPSRRRLRARRSRCRCRCRYCVMSAEEICQFLRAQLQQHDPGPAVRYDRDLSAVKHVGLFGTVYHRRQAQRAGFDDVLFLAADSRITEGATWNSAFLTERAWCGRRPIGCRASRCASYRTRSRSSVWSRSPGRSTRPSCRRCKRLLSPTPVATAYPIMLHPAAFYPAAQRGRRTGTRCRRPACRPRRHWWQRLTPCRTGW